MLSAMPLAAVSGRALADSLDHKGGYGDAQGLGASA